MYSIWKSDEIRTAFPIDKIIRAIQCGSPTLSAISERLKGASGCRDAFETLTSVMMKKLLSPTKLNSSLPGDRPVAAELSGCILDAGLATRKCNGRCVFHAIQGCIFIWRHVSVERLMVSRLCWRRVRSDKEYPVVYHCLIIASIEHGVKSAFWPGSYREGGHLGRF